MIDFDASEIKGWAENDGADGIFPKLIANLVIATVPELSHVDIPSGSAVWMPGWDGILSVVEGNEWIPAGDVACEFSAGGNPQRKAGENYLKRTRRPLRINRTTATFIFFTPRLWDAEKKRQWIERRRRRDDWADIRAYDATDLVNWLHSAPAVADWFARLIGKLPDDGYMCLNDWWDNWSTGTQPQIKPELALAGRTDEADKAMDWLAGPAVSSYIAGDTRDEAIAFLAASAIRSSDHVGPTCLAKAIVIETPDTWRSLVPQRTPMVLIRNFEGDVSSRVAIGNGHHVVIPIDHSQEPRGQGISLPSLGLNKTVEALVSMSLSETEARSLSRRTSRRLPIIRRHLLDEAGAPSPTWASPDPSRCLIALVFIGQWSQDSEADRAAVTALAGKSYEEVERDLTSLLNIADSPITKVGQRWRYVSHEEAWHLLAPYLTVGDAAQFEKLVTEVLSERSPAFDLPLEERYMAGIKGKVPRYSNTLRAGVARTVALMATRPERMANAEDAQFIPHRVVSRVVGDDSDWRTWATLNRHLSTLAEAAPDAFLEGVEKTLNDNEDQVLALFEQDKDPAFAGSPHVGLLFALEILAWSEDYFSEAAILLARLAAIDPGGMVANRPSSSLLELFCPTLRFTEATDDDRIRAVSTLIDRHGDVGWATVIGVFSTRGMMLREPPLWQPWAQGGFSRATIGELQHYLGEMTRLLLENVQSDTHRWKDLVGILTNLPDKSRTEALRLLAERADVIKQGKGIESLRAAIRSILHHHRSHPDAKWAMESADLDAIGAAYDTLQSSDPVEASAWLFESDWIDLPEGEQTDDHTERRARISRAQHRAAQTVLDTGGTDALLRLVDAVKAPHTLGWALADVIADDKVYSLALECIRSDDQARVYFATAYFSEHCRRSGWAVLDRALEDLKSTEGVTAEAIATVYASANSFELKCRLRRLEAEDQPIQDAYWRRINWVYVDDETGDMDAFASAIESLLDVNRSVTASQLIWNKRIPNGLIMRTLEQIPEDLQSGSDQMQRDLGFIFSKLFERLDQSADVPRGDIARLEIPLIYAIRDRRPNLALAREALHEASLFADLVKLTFPSADREQKDALSDYDRDAQISFSYEVLSKLRALPGLAEDGTVDRKILNSWVSDARRLCKDRGNADMGDYKIGKILANAPVGSDGAWPCEPVRDVLECAPSPDFIRSGFRTGKFNLRGITSRGLFDGGTQERDLARKYRSDAASIRGRWPATARLLRGLAETYESTGRREDTRAAWTNEADL